MRAGSLRSRPSIQVFRFFTLVVSGFRPEKLRLVRGPPRTIKDPFDNRCDYFRGKKRSHADPRPDLPRPNQGSGVIGSQSGLLLEQPVRQQLRFLSRSSKTKIIGIHRQA